MTKRYLVHAAGQNLGVLMRKLFGIGTPRGLQGGSAAATACAALLAGMARLTGAGVTCLGIAGFARLVIAALARRAWLVNARRAALITLIRRSPTIAQHPLAA